MHSASILLYKQKAKFLRSYLQLLHFLPQNLLPLDRTMGVGTLETVPSICLCQIKHAMVAKEHK